MKTKEDIHMAIAVLTMLVHKAGTKEEMKLARKSASVLCWVMDYPNEFDKFMDRVKSNPPFDLSPDALNEIIKESIEEVNAGDEGRGGGFSE